MSELFCHDPGLYHPSAQERPVLEAAAPGENLGAPCAPMSEANSQ